MHTFYRLDLAAGPKEVVVAAKKSAKNEIANAYAKFMWVNYNDNGFGILEDYYSKANKEYYRGNISYNRALLAKGDKQMYLFSQAATAYAKSQAIARQVYEFLAPPPTSPSDLGLKPFGGDWAKWETSVGKITVKNDQQ